MQQNPGGHNPQYWRKHAEAKARALSKQREAGKSLPAPALTKHNGFNEVLASLGFAFTLASWGWTVIAPDSSVWFGSSLLLLAVIMILCAIVRLWRPPKVTVVMVATVLLIAFAVFDWYMVIRPQRGKEFKELLVEGYHLTTQCSGIPAHSEMPVWMRDQSKTWEARVGQAIQDRLGYRDIQLWRDAGVLGLVKDVNVNAYQCLSLGIKVETLENLISTHYDPKLKHRDYSGPVYWFDGQQADITDALKQSGGKANVYFYSGDSPEPNQK